MFSFSFSYYEQDNELRSWSPRRLRLFVIKRLTEIKPVVFLIRRKRNILLFEKLINITLSFCFFNVPYM